MLSGALLERLLATTIEPANDVGAEVLRLNPFALCEHSWIFLQRSRHGGFDFTAVRAPFNSDDDARYLKPYLDQGWYPFIANDGDKCRPLAIDAWDPSDPHAALRSYLARWTGWPAQTIDIRLRHSRYVAV